MHQQSTKPKLQMRKGFSLVELLVVIVVVALLVALTLPAMERARSPARKLVCLNNMRNVGSAVVNFSAGANSQLPLLVDPNLETDPANSRPNDHRDDLNWCITVLPYLDNVGFRQRWDATASDAAQDDAAPAQIKALADLNLTRFPFFTCPDDQLNDEPGALSFCVNIGYVTKNYNTASDTSHTADTPTKFASGVFWRPHESRMSLDFISDGDGMTQTLMLSENLQAGDWASPFTGDLGFGVDMERVLTGPSLKLPSGFNLRTAKTDSRIGNNLKAGKGQAWRPSSNHPSGMVNVIFCDGSGKSLTPQMDPGIYARLLTPAGIEYGQVADDPTSY